MDAPKDKANEKSPSQRTPRSNFHQGKPKFNLGKSLSSFFSSIIHQKDLNEKKWLAKEEAQKKSREKLAVLNVENKLLTKIEDDELGSSWRTAADSVRHENPINIDNKLLIKKEDDEFGSSWRSTVSSVYDDAPDQLIPPELGLDLPVKSAFLSPELYSFLESSLPNLVKGCNWILLYSSQRHGISLRTLLRKSGKHPGPCILITGDKQGAIFGAMLECPLTPTPKRKYQGTSHTFVFTTLSGEPRLFRPTGVNRYYFMCLNDFLAFGGGGNYALSLDADLLNGSSGACETFGNKCLAHTPEFELKNVELWGFAHSARYPC